MSRHPNLGEQGGRWYKVVLHMIADVLIVAERTSHHVADVVY
jgi:hypothetical protein